MNRLILIGNGFDLAHGLKTSYKDFINWYWEQRLQNILTERRDVSEDVLCRMKILSGSGYTSWHLLSYENSFFKNPITNEWKISGFEFLKELKSRPDCFELSSSSFFQEISKSIETKGWVDIENEYYQQLKRCAENTDCGYTIKELNEQLAFLQDKLIEYLRTIGTSQYKKELHDVMIGQFDPADFSTEGKKKSLDNMGLERIMLLSFNYTATARMYDNFNLDFNYIHGELEHPENIIFGYGDELDKDYQNILDMNDNELLKNVKSVKYLETRHYHDMLEFLASAPFQVLIMGHSCGNSDRTLLNTVFEHENCVSIKPFYHKWDDGSDNYLELVQNISRNFTNMKLFRDRVVNKEQCKTM